MKKIIALILALVMLSAAACSKSDGGGSSSTTAVEPTQAVVTDPPTQPEPTAASTPEPTSKVTAEPTEAPTDEPTPEPTDDPADGPVEPTPAPLTGNYEDFEGVWYVLRGEIEGDEWDAETDEVIRSVVFYDSYTAERITEHYRSDSDVRTGSVVFSRNSEDIPTVHMKDDAGDAEYDYTISSDGLLIENGTITYDGSETVLTYAEYSRTPFWGEGNYFDRYILTVPDVIQGYIDNAAENAWLVAIADPSEDIISACNEAGWSVIDETDNEWVDCPWNNPKELIIANSSNREVELEIHEPASDYDPKSEESGWQAGPFMYWANLKPGELARFIVDLPERKVDATMCLYMKFEGDETKYYLRIFRYDPEDPYITF